MKKAGKRINVRFNFTKEPKIFRLRNLVQQQNGNLSLYMSFAVKCMYEGVDRRECMAGVNTSLLYEKIGEKEADIKPEKSNIVEDSGEKASNNGKYEVFGFYISDSTKNIIESLSVRTGFSASAVVKKAIEWYVEETENEYLKLEDDISDMLFENVVGIKKSGDTDFAKNVNASLIPERNFNQEKIGDSVKNDNDYEKNRYDYEKIGENGSILTAKTHENSKNDDNNGSNGSNNMNNSAKNDSNDDPAESLFNSLLGW